MHGNRLKGKKALVMGLGLHGGGLASALFLLDRGAHVRCTDLRDAETLAPSLEALSGKPVEYTLGEHRMEDFDDADIIIKNPAVPADSPWIAGRTNVETDISLFLEETGSPIIAVTGSKGKSTVVSALHHILLRDHPDARLGGNITVSPLTFIDELGPGTPVVLELSSWQLADLRGRDILKPRIACITNLMHDHQNRYDSFADYEADKMVIFESLPDNGHAVFPDDDFGRKWSSLVSSGTTLVRTSPSPSTGTPAPDSPDAMPGGGSPTARLNAGGEGLLDGETIVPGKLGVPGGPFRGNMLFAATIARKWGCDAGTIRSALGDFPGVPYRMEMFLEEGGIRFYDDTAATIPDAAAAAVRSVDGPVILVAGGTDKELDFAPFRDICGIPKTTILLPGTATDEIIAILQSAGAPYDGPFDSMEEAVGAAVNLAESGDSVILSPGAASFGLFRHEFERGDAFKAACREAASRL